MRQIIETDRLVVRQLPDNVYILAHHIVHTFTCGGRPIVQIGGINDIIRCQFFRLLGDLARVQAAL